MARSGIALTFMVLLAVFEMGSCLRCYICHSDHEKDCVDPFASPSKYLMDCSPKDAKEYREYLEMLTVPSKFLDGISGVPHCAKIYIKFGSKAITLRTCLKADTKDSSATCRELEHIVKPTSDSKDELQCGYCNKDGCNGAGSFTASLPVALFALVVSFLYSKQYLS